MGRAPCCDKANVKKGPWAPEEDAKLKTYIDEYGTGGNWIALPQKIGLKRCGKSCRLRWLNYLRPNIKHGGFSEEEDRIICSLYISIGSRWSIIAAQLPGRTDNDIKNYWNTRLKKKLLGRRRDSQARCVSSFNQDGSRLDDCSYSHTLSNTTLERMQLHMQLQGSQNPLSYYNNPSLWPKIHPFGERNTQQNFQVQLDNSTEIEHDHERKMNQLPTSTVLVGGKRENSTVFVKDISSSENSAEYSDGFNSIEVGNMNFASVSSLQAELGDLILKKTGEQTNDFDCFKDMDSVKESMIWWENSFDGISSSLGSWDAPAYAIQQKGQFQDSPLGYDI
ncbi:hypothetical protein ACHQM5_030207 [Ranunculus cassubicifolius]